VMIGSNISSGQNHGARNIPVAVAGGAGGRLKGGRIVRAKGETIASLHRSILEMMNINEKMGGGSGKLDGFA
jgi:hypothetical protein